MGYESKLYIVRKYPFNSSIPDFAASEIVASLDMCKMGYEHRLLSFFTCQAPFALRIEDYDEEHECDIMKDVVEDKYGDPIMYCTDINSAIEEAKRMIKADGGKDNCYWRLNLLLRFLKMYRMYDNTEDIFLCHYGY